MGFDLGLIIIFSFEIILSFVFLCVGINYKKKIIDMTIKILL